MSESFLQQHDAAAWARTRESILPSVHEVDRDATRIWFHFFPLALADALERSNNPEELARTLRLEGRYRLSGQVDSSHWFLYGHRYWPQVKAAIVEWATGTAATAVDLDQAIHAVAKKAAAAAGADESLVVGLAAIGLMTLRQTGLSAFAHGSNTGEPATRLPTRSPAEIVAARRKDDSQGLFGFLRGTTRRYSIRFDERHGDRRFTLINDQHLTTAAAADRRDFAAGDRPSREGPIPSDCRSASCGTCWVGVLGGAEKLSEVEPLEARRLKEFGYSRSTEGTPAIRLACMARATGNVTVVIPPWNGQIGKAGLGAV